jgi:hypothetical protein
MRRYVDFLESCGAREVEHSGQTFLDHLLGTCEMLRQWNAPRRVTIAGLFHSIYGTEMLSMRSVNLSRRDEVRALIGERAEQIVYLFCTARRLSLYVNVYHEGPYWIEFIEGGDGAPIEREVLSDLLLLDIANTVEQARRADPSHSLHEMSDFYEDASAFVPEVALRELRSVLAEQPR